MSLSIVPLADRPELAPVVAQWRFAEWGHHYPGGTVEGWWRESRTWGAT